MAALNANVTAYVECRRKDLPVLIEFAARVDRYVGTAPPKDGYGLAEAFSAILNGGTAEDIQAALTIVAGWNFQPAQ